MPNKTLPTLYATIDIVDRSRHKFLRLRSDVSYRFASRATIVPIVHSEFRRASIDMPIAFIRKENDIFAQAVLGIATTGNVFISAEGHWKQGSYIPAYIRRYPFILVNGEGRKFLGFDVGAKHFSKVEGEQLFDVNGEILPAIERIQEFCNAFDTLWAQTQEFVSEVDAAGLFVPAIARVSGTQERTIDGFEMVDRERLLDISADTLKKWEAKGWLDAIRSHHASLDKWGSILRNDS